MWRETGGEIKTETKRHIEAFDFYYSMGADRNHAAVAERYKVGKRAVERWSRSFNWQERVAQRDIENGRKIMAKTDRGVVNTKADYRADLAKDRTELRAILTRYGKLIADATEKIQAGTISAETIKDLTDLATAFKGLSAAERDMVKLDLALIGEGEAAGNKLEVIVRTDQGIDWEKV